MDVEVRDKRTGEKKILPIAVARMNKNRFLILSEIKDTIQQPVKSAPTVQPSAQLTYPPNSQAPQAEPKKEVVDAVSEANPDSELEELREAYKAKFGSPAHGRMKADSLRKAIEA